MSIEIIANVFRQRSYSVALIEPCFDNIADIFCRHDISLTPITEDVLFNPSVLSTIITDEIDAIFLVSPNNPTGISYNRETLTEIAAYCASRSILVVVDSTFRFYADRDHHFNEYEILSDSGVEFIFIEDTGKTWPTHDLKVSLLSTNSEIYNDLHQVHTDFILHVSPFTIKVTTEFIKNSIRDELASVINCVDLNRLYLKEAIENTCLTMVNDSFGSVAWLRIANHYSSNDIVDALKKNNVQVLPGNNFFWSRPELGAQYLRIALTRDGDKFEQAAHIIRDTLQTLK